MNFAYGFATFLQTPYQAWKFCIFWEPGSEPKKSPGAKKKEEKRGERETKEKRGEEESKYGMKKVKRDQGKRKRAPVTPNQTVGAKKKPGREKEKRKTRKVLEQKKRR